MPYSTTYYNLLFIVMILFWVNCGGCGSSKTNTSDNPVYKQVLSATISESTLDTIVDSEDFNSTLSGNIIPRDGFVVRSDLYDDLNIISRSDITNPIPIDDVSNAVFKQLSGKGYAYIATLLTENCSFPKVLLENSETVDVLDISIALATTNECEESASIVVQVITSNMSIETATADDILFTTVISLPDKVNVTTLQTVSEINGSTDAGKITYNTETDKITSENSLDAISSTSNTSNSNGTWETIITLDRVPDQPGLAIIDNTLYILGNPISEGNFINSSIMLVNLDDVSVTNYVTEIQETNWANSTVVIDDVIFTYDNAHQSNSNPGTIYQYSNQSVGSSVKTSSGDENPLPNPRTDLAVVGSGRNIYYIGGADGTSLGENVFESLQIMTLPENLNQPNLEVTWTTGKNAPYAIRNHCAVIDNVFITIYGGYTNNTSGTGGRSQITSNASQYDTSDDTWTSLPSLNIERARHSCVILNGFVWIMGGVFNNLENAEPTDDVSLYGLINQTETTNFETLPQAMSNFSATVDTSGRIYVGVGNNGEIWRFTPSSKNLP